MIGMYRFGCIFLADIKALITMIELIAMLPLKEDFLKCYPKVRASMIFFYKAQIDPIPYNISFYVMFFFFLVWDFMEEMSLEITTQTLIQGPQQIWKLASLISTGINGSYE
uniref:Uncharacterized protein n=1 Tax=Anguilla anguilla TaxID=7936 RepID=A0A0E9X6U2_ANGAN